MTQLFAFSDKHAAFERNGNMSLFEKFELAREVSEICDSVVPLIKVVIVEGGNRGGGAASDDVVAAVHAAATGHRRSCGTGCWDDGKPAAAVLQSRPRSEACRNPFGAIMDDDVDRSAVAACRVNGKRKTAAAVADRGKCIELKLYSRSVNYFHEQLDDPPAVISFAARRTSLRA